MRHRETRSITCDERGCAAVVWGPIMRTQGEISVEDFALEHGWQIGEMRDALRRIGGDRCPAHTQWLTSPLAGIVCPTCGALVCQERRSDHEKWHKS